MVIKLQWHDYRPFFKRNRKEWRRKEGREEDRKEKFSRRINGSKICLQPSSFSVSRKGKQEEKEEEEKEEDGQMMRKEGRKNKILHSLLLDPFFRPKYNPEEEREEKKSTFSCSLSFSLSLSLSLFPLVLLSLSSYLLDCTILMSLFLLFHPQWLVQINMSGCQYFDPPNSTLRLPSLLLVESVFFLPLFSQDYFLRLFQTKNSMLCQ